MTDGLDKATMANAYARWAPIYDLVFGKVFGEENVKKMPLSVEVNRAATDATVVDYATGKTSRSIKTGPSSTLDLTLKASDGALLRATGTLKLDVFGFVQAEGTFGVEKRTNQQIVLGGGATVAVDELLIGGGSLTGFVGLNGGQMGFGAIACM